MNFFEQQDRSRRATQQLLGLFSAAVVFICICVYGGVMLVMNTSKSPPYLTCQPVIPVSPTATPTASPAPRLKGWDGENNRISSGRSPVRTLDSNISPYLRSTNSRFASSNVRCYRTTVWWNGQIFCGAFSLTAGIIGMVSGWKINQLKAGGACIAVELGGRRVLAEIATPAELQLLNIVEEMAIAATIAVPSVYILDSELGINCFAAGFTVNDAVIGVTRGSLNKLSRDELQGAIAHEFSHILNGDMAMNIRLTGLLHGILALYLVGRVLICFNSNRNPLGYLGFLLMVIGASGCLAGRLIQSAISRQRELLADASAVQFTRNPDAVASAMAKASDFGSYLSSPYAETNNHMFFAPAIDFGTLTGLFSAHPTAARRKNVIMGTGQRLGQKIVINGETVPTFKPIISTSMTRPTHPEMNETPARGELVNPVGEYAALAYIYALLLNPDQATQQLDYLDRIEEPAVIAQITQFQSTIAGLPLQQRLVAIEQQVAKIRGTEHAPRLFKAATEMMTTVADEDWQTAIVYLILNHRLTLIKSTAATYHSIEDVWVEMINIISTVARFSSDRSKDISYGFEASLLRLPPNLAKQAQLPPAITWREFQADLTKIAAANPNVKQTLIAACLEILITQRRPAPATRDLMRSIAICLDCPVPPLLARLDRSPSLTARL